MRKGGQPSVDKESRLTAEVARSMFSYDPESGHVVSKGGWFKRRPEGARVGTTNAYGYRTIRIGDAEYKEHRLIWLLVNGEWPRQFIDHINGKRDDNRLANLREVDGATNSRNRQRANKNSLSGLIGVSVRKEIPEGGRRYRARVNLDGRDVWLGHFATAEEAHAAYCAARAQTGSI